MKQFLTSLPKQIEAHMVVIDAGVDRDKIKFNEIVGLIRAYEVNVSKMFCVVTTDGVTFKGMSGPNQGEFVDEENVYTQQVYHKVFRRLIEESSSGSSKEFKWADNEEKCVEVIFHQQHNQKM